MSEQTTLPIDDYTLFKKKSLIWASQFSTFQLLDGHLLPHKYTKIDTVLTVDVISELKLYDTENAFEKLTSYHASKTENIYGYIAYDLKNDTEKLSSNLDDHLGFPELYFFEPRYKLNISANSCTINRNFIEASYIKDSIDAIRIEDNELTHISWSKRLNKDTYMRKVNQIKDDIENGIVYELNFCYEMYATLCHIDPIGIFNKINEKVKAPFSSCMKIEDKFILSFSPERFLQLDNNQLLSQPIKGTRKKGRDESENTRIERELLNDEKERAENVMIVDLVRNDLAKSAETGTVKVEELFGIYSFENIIQMISTIKAKKRKTISSINALKNCFPMGSMTGAPKFKTMQRIEQLELSKRGVYSGAIGYIKPCGSFDFSVVIRTLLYNASKKYLSYTVGGAITYDSDAEKEWAETQIKAESILQHL